MNTYEIATPTSLQVLQKIRKDEGKPDVPKIALPRYTPVIRYADAFAAQVVTTIGLKVR